MGGQTDKQYDGQLIDMYKILKTIRDAAAKENATETVKLIEEEMNFLKIKLRPTELPE